MSVDQLALKNATKALVRAVGGGEAAAGFCRVRQQQLSEYGNPNMPGVFMPVDVVADLEALTIDQPGHPHVTKELARRAGYGLCPLPRATPNDKSWLEHLACLSKEAMDPVATLATALAGAAEVTPAAVKTHRLIEETDEAIQALIDLRAQLRGVLPA